MKLLLLAVAAVVGVASHASTGKVDYHLNSMIETMPPSVEMLQIQASMLSGTTIDVRDEIAALLFKMQKDITNQENEERRNNIITQNRCERRFRSYRRNIKNAQTIQKAQKKKEQQHHAVQKAIPGQVLKLERRIRLIKIDIRTAEADLKRKQEQRDNARDSYLKGIADFNKALDDIDTLRTLVETGLSNRGQGAATGDARFTQSPTVKGTTAPPTKIAYDTKVTQTATNAGAFVEGSEDNADPTFVEYKSSEQLSSMSRQEAIQTMKGIYSDLKKSTSNPVVLAVVDTLDSAMVELHNSNAVDKIRSLLIQVRNELQKSKREATAAENAAINAWKSQKVSLRNKINDYKINWNQIYKSKAFLWKKYGDEFQSEGHAMRKFAIAKRSEDHNTINLSFESVVCKTQNEDYKRNSAKRHGQLAQIKKALNLLSKFGLAGKYGSMVRESIKDVTAGLCRVFDDYSKWVSVAPTDYVFSARGNAMSGVNPPLTKEAYIYNNTDAKGGKFVCMSEIRYTFVCGIKCDMRTNDKRLAGYVHTPNDRFKRFPRIVDITRDFNKPRTATIRLKKPLKYNPSVRNVVLKGTGLAKRTDIEIYVIPGCNCNNPNSDYVVTDNQANTVDQGEGFVEAGSDDDESQ